MTTIAAIRDYFLEVDFWPGTPSTLPVADQNTKRELQGSVRTKNFDTRRIMVGETLAARSSELEEVDAWCR
jgi:hypothetical protein